MKELNPELQQLIKEIKPSDTKTENAIKMMFHKIYLLELWRREGLPEIDKNGDTVLYSNFPTNPTQFMGWEDSLFCMSKTSRSFYYRKVTIGIGGEKILCKVIEKLRFRAEKALDYYKNQGKNKQKRNKVIQDLRNRVKQKDEIINGIADQIHILLEQLSEAERKVEELTAEKQKEVKRNAMLTEKIIKIEAMLYKKRGGLKSV